MSHRTVAIRMLRGFRIISAVAAAVLAGFFAPLELQVLMCRDRVLRAIGGDYFSPGKAILSGVTSSFIVNWRLLEVSVERGQIT
jgi:hypothetical protein